MRWKLGGEARDPTPADVEAAIAEGLNERLGDPLMDLEVMKAPAPASPHRRTGLTERVTWEQNARTASPPT
jgi:hypothetical protein